MLDPNNFLMTTKKSTSHDAIRIALVDFFCKDIKICFFAGDRHWMYTGILLPIPIIEYQAIKLSTFIVNYYQIPSTVTNYLHNNINQLLKELSVKGTKKSLSLVSVSDSEYFEIISILSYDNTHRITNCSFPIE